MKFIPYGRQLTDANDVKAVSEVFRSGYLTTGPKVREFEEELAAYCDARFAVVCSNGTAALHLACLALGLKEKESIVTSPITFLATANCARFVGAEVVFSDIDSGTVNIDPDRLSVTLKKAKGVKALFPVHFAGQPADMEAIQRIAKAKKLKVVEDASHALGASYTSGGKKVKIGSCRHSDMTVFSFHPIKTITTGEGGAVTTNDEKFYRRLLLFRNHGMERREDVGPWYYEMNELGFNYRLTDIQCALGLSQLKKADRFVARRREIAAYYDKHLKGSKFFETPVEEKRARSSYHLYALRMDFNKIGKSRAELMRSLAKKGIGTQVHYIPLTRQPYYRKRYRLNPANFPNAEKYYEQALSLPIHAGMSQKDVNRVVRTIQEVV